MHVQCCIAGDALAQAVMVMKIEFDMIYGGEFGLPYVGAAAAFLAVCRQMLTQLWHWAPQLLRGA